MDAAVERTVATAGRTVLFSGLAVAISFAGLMLFPAQFLSSMGYSAVATVAFAVLGSLLFLPAMLRLAGRRVGAARPATGRRWYRVAHAVMRRPLLATAGLVLVLLALGLPVLGVGVGAVRQFTGNSTTPGTPPPPSC